MKLHVFHLFLLILHPWMITSPHFSEYLDTLDPTPENFVDEFESFVTYTDIYLSRSVDTKHFDTSVSSPFCAFRDTVRLESTSISSLKRHEVFAVSHHAMVHYSGRSFHDVSYIDKSTALPCPTRGDTIIHKILKERCVKSDFLFQVNVPF